MPTLISPPIPAVKVLDRLWVATIWSAKELVVSNPGFGMILNCTDETLPKINGVHMLQLGLLDRRPVPHAKLLYAVRVIQEYMFQSAGSGRRVLVCCHSAVSRSPAIVLTYLLGCGMGFDEALRLLEDRHPRTDIAPEIMESILACFGS